MPKQIVATPQMPKPVVPISRAIRAGDFVYLAGLTGRREDGSLPNGMEAQARQLFANMKYVLGCAGGTLSDVIRVEVHSLDHEEMAGFNVVWTEHFSEAPPARIAVQVAGLNPGVRVEVTAVAYLGSERAE